MQPNHRILPRYCLGPALLALALAHCNNGDDATLPECFGPVAPAVSSGLTPNVDWEPACRLIEVSISDGASGTLVWSILGADAINELEPGIDYGIVPSNGQALLPPMDLIAGHEYHVSVYRLDLSRPLLPVIRLSGDVAFTP